MDDADHSAPVERFTTEEGFRIYRIRHQALPHLIGYVHLLLGEDGYPATLFDTGSGSEESLSQIMTGFNTVRDQFGENFDPTVIRRIIISHAHVDHFGGANELARITGAKVLCHPFDSRIVTSFNERATVANARYANFLIDAGVTPEEVEPILRGFGFFPGRCRSTPVDRLVEEGESFDGLEFFHLPGHSAGHLAVRIGNFLLSGDVVLSKTLTQNWPESLFPYCGLDRYLESIRRLDRMAAANPNLTLLPAHEDPVTVIPRRIELVFKAEQRRNDRLLSILDRADAPLALNEIARNLYLTAHKSRAFFALSDVAARIEYLQLRAKIAVANYDEIGRGGRVLRYRGC